MTDQSTPPLTLAKVESIRARAKAATPGPWRINTACGEVAPFSALPEAFVETAEGELICRFDEYGDDEANAAHIAGLDPLTFDALCALAEAHLRQTAEPAEKLYEHVRSLGFHGPDAKPWRERSVEHQQLWIDAVRAIAAPPPPTNAIAVVERVRDEWLKESGMRSGLFPGERAIVANEIIAALKEEGL